MTKRESLIKGIEFRRGDADRWLERAKVAEESGDKERAATYRAEAQRMLEDWQLLRNHLEIELGRAS